MTQPYQPLFLRILHSVNGLLVLGAMITAFWVYNTYDGRFGRIALPVIPDIQGLHGTFGLTFLLVFPFFAVYSFHAGQKKLLQPDSLKNLARIHQPIGWISLHRLVNTLTLGASVFALISGRLMQEKWLPAGELHHLAYSLHLLSWLIMAIALAFHILTSARVGGGALILSIVNWRVRAADPAVQMFDRFRHRQQGDRYRR